MGHDWGMGVGARAYAQGARPRTCNGGGGAGRQPRAIGPGARLQPCRRGAGAAWAGGWHRAEQPDSPHLARSASFPAPHPPLPAPQGDDGMMHCHPSSRFLLERTLIFTPTQLSFSPPRRATTASGTSLGGAWRGTREPSAPTTQPLAARGRGRTARTTLRPPTSTTRRWGAGGGLHPSSVRVCWLARLFRDGGRAWKCGKGAARAIQRRPTSAARRRGSGSAPLRLCCSHPCPAAGGGGAAPCSAPKFSLLCSRPPLWQEAVRRDLSEWLRYLRNSIGFDGWRFDYVKGCAWFSCFIRFWAGLVWAGPGGPG